MFFAKIISDKSSFLSIRTTKIINFTPLNIEKNERIGLKHRDSQRKSVSCNAINVYYESEKKYKKQLLVLLKELAISEYVSLETMTNLMLLKEMKKIISLSKKAIPSLSRTISSITAKTKM
ncbi:hypothetical protein EG338_07025 [Kaistella haifensis]|nr:hypothetical protein EG338_07025 [Kaistella haifensis]